MNTVFIRYLSDTPNICRTMNTALLVIKLRVTLFPDYSHNAILDKEQQYGDLDWVTQTSIPKS
jgi:hypothetical protein